MQKDRKMTAPVIYSIAVSSPRGLAAPAARNPSRLARHREGPRSVGRAMALHLLRGSPAAAVACLPIRAWGAGSGPGSLTFTP